jgi:hypothetical protein
MDKLCRVENPSQRLIENNHCFRLGCPYILPIYNPNGIHIESYDHLQPINDCHLICMCQHFSYQILSSL